MGLQISLLFCERKTKNGEALKLNQKHLNSFSYIDLFLLDFNDFSLILQALSKGSVQIFRVISFLFVFYGSNSYLCRPKLEIKTMANHKATKKDVRQSKKRNERNRYYGKTTRNAIRDLKKLTEKAAADEKLSDVISMIDKLAKRNVIHKNKAANLKSKLSKKVNTIA